MSALFAVVGYSQWICIGLPEDQEDLLDIGTDAAGSFFVTENFWIVCVCRDREEAEGIKVELQGRARALNDADFETKAFRTALRNLKRLDPRVPVQDDHRLRVFYEVYETELRSLFENPSRRRP